MNDEKELIKSTKAFPVIPAVMVIAGVILLIVTITTHWSWDDFAFVMLFVSPAISVIGVVLYFYSGMCSITVTDKRVYGKTTFGSRVDLPFDMISAVGTIGVTHGITVATSSGGIKFMYIENSAEIHETISKLLMDRQDNKNSTKSNAQEVSIADELIRYKKLLDQGIISKEEFDAKKKQLLGV